MDENMNKTLLEISSCMLSQSRLDRRYWVEAINTICFLVSHSLSTTNRFKTLFHIWFDQTTNYFILKVFGVLLIITLVMVGQSPKPRTGFYVLWGQAKGFRIWSPSEQRIIVSREVTLIESSLLQSKGSSSKSEVVAQQVRQMVLLFRR